MSIEHPIKTIDTTYDSSIDAIYLEAWKKTNSIKTIFWQALTSIVLIIVITSNFNFTLSGILTIGTGADPRYIHQFIQLIVNIFVLMPLFTGLFMLSMKHCSGLSAPINTIFQYFPYWKRLYVFPIVLMLFGTIGEFFSGHIGIQLGIFFLCAAWGVIYFMYIPLAIEKNLPVETLLEISRKAIFENASHVFGFILFATVIVIFSLLTCGIAFIWTLPWLFNAIAVFYRELFGMQISLM